MVENLSRHLAERELRLIKDCREVLLAYEEPPYPFFDTETQVYAPTLCFLGYHCIFNDQVLLKKAMSFRDLILRTQGVDIEATMPPYLWVSKQKLQRDYLGTTFLALLTLTDLYALHQDASLLKSIEKGIDSLLTVEEFFGKVTLHPPASLSIEILSSLAKATLNEKYVAKAAGIIVKHETDVLDRSYIVGTRFLPLYFSLSLFRLSEIARSFKCNKLSAKLLDFAVGHAHFYKDRANKDGSFVSLTTIPVEASSAYYAKLMFEAYRFTNNTAYLNNGLKTLRFLRKEISNGNRESGKQDVNGRMIWANLIPLIALFRAENIKNVEISLNEVLEYLEKKLDRTKGWTRRMEYNFLIIQPLLELLLVNELSTICKELKNNPPVMHTLQNKKIDLACKLGNLMYLKESLKKFG